MSWQVLILLHAFIAAFQTLQSRAIARIPKARHAALAVNAAAFSALFVVGVIIILFSGPINWSEARDYWHVLFLAAICFAFASTYMYRSLVYMESAVVSVVTTITALFTLILAGIVFGERLSTIQLLGSLLLLPCIWYVLSLAIREKQGVNIHSKAWLKGLSFALLASFFFACGFVLEKYAINHVTFSTYIGVGWGFQVLIAWVLVLTLRRHTLKVLKDPSVSTMSLRLGVIRAAAGALFLLALVKSNNVTLMSVISNFRIIVVAVLAGVLLKERDHYQQKMAAAALSFVALAIIFYN
jgi:drug/metabolite transporter (DMT)-like permease